MNLTVNGQSHSVDVDPSTRNHRHPIMRPEFPIAMRRPERYALHRRVALFQCEVVVSAGRQLQPRDFARDPNVAELLVEHGADGGVQLADREYAALREEIEFECELLQAIMVARVSFSPRRHRDTEKFLHR